MEKYIVLNTISINLFSKLILIKDKNNNKFVIKEIQNKNDNEFKICKIINSLENKYLVKYIESMENNIIYEYFEGQTLDDLRFKLTDDQILLILNQILDFLIILKNKGYCYYDLSLSNIIVDKNFNIKVIDYSTIFKINQKVNVLVGTYGFIPPEYFNNNILKYEQFNVFSLGLIVFTLIFKFFLFDKNSNYLKKCWKFCKKDICSFNCMEEYIMAKNCNEKLKKFLIGSLNLDYQKRYNLTNLKNIIS